ncbi:MAG: CRISPR-associated protein Csx19, partial [Candidatus Brocadia sp.]
MPDMLKYKLTSIKKKEPMRMAVDDLEKLAQEHFTVKSYVVAYLDYEVFVGIWSGGKFYFYKDIKIDSKFIQKIRIFNKNAELLAWRSSDGLNGRIRIDEDGGEVSTVEAYQALFGTKTVENMGNFTKISEERGTALILP